MQTSFDKHMAEFIFSNSLDPDETDDFNNYILLYITNIVYIILLFIFL